MPKIAGRHCWLRVRSPKTLLCFFPRTKDCKQTKRGAKEQKTSPLSFPFSSFIFCLFLSLSFFLSLFISFFSLPFLFSLSRKWLMSILSQNVFVFPRWRLFCRSNFPGAEPARRDNRGCSRTQYHRRWIHCILRVTQEKNRENRGLWIPLTHSFVTQQFS